MDHTITLQYEETVNIQLPNGQKVSILLSYPEPGEQLPELDIMLPETLTANCFEPHLKPASPNPNMNNVLDVKQIIIPINP